MIMHDADSEYVAQHAKQQLDRMRAEFTGNKQTLKSNVYVSLVLQISLRRLETWKLELEDWHCVEIYENENAGVNRCDAVMQNGQMDNAEKTQMDIQKFINT